jgi:hypothetical protein
MVYFASLIILGVGAIALGRSLGLGWIGTSTFLVLLAVRHRIARTGVNSLEGYMTPRLLAYGLVIGACAAAIRKRPVVALTLAILATIAHPTTGAWGVILVTFVMLWAQWSRQLTWTTGLGALVVIAAGALAPLPSWLTVMDPAWLSVFDEKDYLFSAEWPLYAWVLNAGYVGLIVMTHAVRRRSGLTTVQEDGLVAGLVLLVVAFIASIPWTERHVALAVQLQVNRVFWFLDGLTACYVAWWLTTGRDGAPRRTAVVVMAVLALGAAARGYYLVHIVGHRPLVEIDLPQNSWNEAMLWIRRQPSHWHVLAAPDHAITLGPSVRAAALRDTLLERNKDSAIAIYDRGVAERVRERTDAIGSFDDLTLERVQALDQRYDLDVLVDRNDRSFPLPILYRNADFIVYDLH